MAHNTEGTDRPICPKCGYEHEEADTWRSDSGLNACANCEYRFYWRRLVSISYSTRPEET